jgi:hypothetical protein
MTPIAHLTVDGCEQVLVEFLSELFATRRLGTAFEALVSPPELEADSWAGKKPPQVRRGFIPRNVTGFVNVEHIPDFPCIIVQARDVSEGFGVTATTVEILIGVHDNSPDYQGHRDVLNMYEAMRIAFWSERVIKDTISIPDGSHFRFQPLDDQHPHFFGLYTTVWNTPTPDYYGEKTVHDYA